MKMGKRFLMMLLSVTLGVSLFTPISAKEVSNAETLNSADVQENVGILFEDDFDAYNLGSIDLSMMKTGYKSVKGAEIVEVDGSQAVQLNTGELEVAIDDINKQVEFDFQYDSAYSRWGGIYTKMYKNSNSSLDYYFSLNPNFTTKIFISAGTSNLATNNNKVMDAKTWYSCKAILKNEKISVKVWQRGTNEPDAWDLEYENTGFKRENGSGTFSIQIDPLGSATKTMIDNLVISKSVDDSQIVSIVAESNDQTMGLVTGGGNYSIGDQVSVKAMPNDHYRFSGWLENGDIVSRNMEYVFEATSSRHLVANFVELKEPTYEYFLDNYESYDLGTLTKDKMPSKYVMIEDGFSISSKDNSQVLQMDTLDGSNRRIVMDCDLVDKQVQFDFYFENDFTGHDGFYIKLHAQPNAHDGDDEYYFSINPNFGDKNLIVSCNTQNLSFTKKEILKQNWYTCKSRILNGKIMVKIWSRAQEEPADWDTVCELSGFPLVSQGTRFKIEYVDRTGQLDSYIDNFSVKTWEKLDDKAEYVVTAKTNDDTMGSVAGSGFYLEGNEVTLIAKPNKKYKFVNWTDSEGNVVSEDKKYRFQATSDCTLIAHFEKIELMIRSFMANGLTKLAEIDEKSKTVNLQFASDIDLTKVKPYFYYDPEYIPSVLPYEMMDLSQGEVQFDGWTICAKQNSLMKEFYVDVKKGHDENDGTKKSPFQSIERAQEAIREIKNWTGDVVVHLAAGNYVLDETLKFTQNDGADKGYSVLYSGACANDTIISSGILLKGWKLSHDVPQVDGVYEVDVPNGAGYSRDLYIGNKKADLASENTNQAEFSNRNSYGYTVSGNMANMDTWRNQSDIEFVYDVGWTSNILPVQEIKKEDGVTKVVMKAEPFKNSAIKLNCNPNKPNMIQNAFELLDETNEWYFDRERNKIYYIPEKGVDPNNLYIVLPTLEKLVEVKGEGTDKVYGLGFQDIGFKYTSFMRPHTDGQIELQASFVFDPNMEETNNHDNFLKTPGGVTAGYVEGMRVNNCIFATMAAAGFDYEEGVVGSTVAGSRFEQIGAAGMQIGGVRVRDAQPYSDVTYEQGVLNTSAGADPHRVSEDILIMSNVVDTVGVNFRGSIGIWAGYVRDLTLAQNELKNISYSGISAGWGWGIWDQGGRADFPNYYKFDTPSIQERYVIENNNISSCMQRLNDGGAIYTLSNMPGSIIRGNYIHDIPNPYGAIYLDEGSGGMVDISHNVVYNVYRPYFYHLVAHYSEYAKECLAAQHDNFFTTGQPTNPEDPSFVEIKNNSGNVNGYIPPELKEPIITKVNKDALQERYDYAFEQNTDNLIPNQKDVFDYALAHAKEVLGNPYATQEEVNQALELLEDAIQGLIYVKGDKTALKNLIDQADVLVKDDYFEDDWSEFEHVLKDALEMYENENVLQSMVDEALKALKDAMNALVKKPVETGVDKLALQIAVNVAKEVNDDELKGVIGVVVKEFKAALAGAEEILIDASATQAEVDSAFDRLADVMWMLEFKRADVEQMVKFINDKKLKELLAREDEYIPNTWEAFAKAYEKAKAIAADENEMDQDKVDVAYQELVRAFINLRLIPNKDKLDDLIKQANSLDASKYTVASYNRVKQAISKANELVEPKQPEVDAVVAELEVALKGLVVNKAEEFTHSIRDEKTLVADKDTTKPTAGEKTNNNTVKTADDTAIALLLTMMFVSMAYVYLFKKKED